MPRIFTIVSYFLAAFLLFPVATPGSYCPPTCQSTAGLFTVVDNADFALCSGFTFVPEGHHHCTERLLLPWQACTTHTPFIAASFPRAPPSCFVAL
jgi:hypothetical protein